MDDRIICKKEAIDRMRDGLPCETCFPNYDWEQTTFTHFDMPKAMFRIPPEPRREAREFWIEARRDGPDYAWGNRCTAPNAIHVREVLPDEVTLRKITENGVRDFVFDKNVVAARCSTGADKCVAFARALDLIAEKKS